MGSEWFGTVNYWLAAVLLLIGLHGMLMRSNLIKNSWR